MGPRRESFWFIGSSFATTLRTPFTYIHFVPSYTFNYMMKKGSYLQGFSPMSYKQLLLSHQSQWKARSWSIIQGGRKRGLSESRVKYGAVKDSTELVRELGDQQTSMMRTLALKSVSEVGQERASDSSLLSPFWSGSKQINAKWFHSFLSAVRRTAGVQQ